MKRLYLYLFFLFLCLSAQAQEFRVYQFPAAKVPAIDGNTHDWDCVPAAYKITEAALKEDEGKHAQPDTTTLKVSVKVGWCAEMCIRDRADGIKHQQHSAGMTGVRQSQRYQQNAADGKPEHHAHKPYSQFAVVHPFKHKGREKLQYAPEKMCIRDSGKCPY